MTTKSLLVYVNIDQLLDAPCIVDTCFGALVPCAHVGSALFCGGDTLKISIECIMDRCFPGKVPPIRLSPFRDEDQ